MCNHRLYDLSDWTLRIIIVNRFYRISSYSRNKGGGCNKLLSQHFTLKGVRKDIDICICTTDKLMEREKDLGTYRRVKV